MKLLLTGAAGYAGVGVGESLLKHHHVRGMDVKPGDTYTDFMQADITDLDACRRAVAGVDAVVMCHMAKNPDAYQTPVLAIDINVKGTANLYHAMAEQEIERAVLISSTGVLLRDRVYQATPGEGPYNFAGKMYGLTKIMQENLARFYFETSHIITTILRPGWIVYDEKLITKYGDRMEFYNEQLIDPRDIGVAVHQALNLADPGLECFQIAQDDAKLDQQATHARLGWRPTFRFKSLKRAEA